MALIVLSARVTLQKTSLIPADAVVNTFTIGADDATVDYGGIAGALQAFYDVDAPGASGRLTYLMGSSIGRVGAPHSVDFYDVTDHLDGSPLLTDAVASVGIGLTTAGVGADLPAECAICLTLFGTGRDSAAVSVGSTRPKQRRTGRIFFGPLTAGAVATVAGEVRVHASAMADVGAAARQLPQDLADVDAGLLVWSRADAAVYAVVSGYVDNAFDTIRSRGPAPTNRDGFIV